MGIGATLGLVVLGIAVCGVAAGVGCYFLVPWGRVVDAEAAPEGVPVVRLTRLGTTLGALSAVPMAAGSWLTYAGTVAGLTATAGAEPTPLQRVALAVPGEVLLVGSVAGGVVAVLLPVWVSAAVVARRTVEGWL